MVDESVAFFQELVRENLGVKNVIHSDFAMLNERLAEHYRIPGVRGVEIRKVMLPANSRRGGLLTQGAVLKVSANGTSTSPVVRGAYVLARFLGTPPEPPPKSVPAIEPDIRGATTIREQLEKHRADASCATCHANLDPPGFALESFDVTGRWRTNYRVLPESTKGRVVTIAGCDARLFAEGPKVVPGYMLEDGRAFEDIDGFKQLMLSNEEQRIDGLVACSHWDYGSGMPRARGRTGEAIGAGQSEASHFGCEQRDPPQNRLSHVAFHFEGSGVSDRTFWKMASGA
jgi:hypothetical protein